MTPTTAARRRELLAALGIITLVLGVVLVQRLRDTLSARATAEQCAALLDRYVEQLARANDPRPASSTIALERAEARELAARSPSFARCSEAVSHEQASCALAAHNADEIERCLQ